MRYLCNECEAKFDRKKDAIEHLIAEHFDAVAEVICAYFVVEEVEE